MQRSCGFRLIRWAASPAAWPEPRPARWPATRTQHHPPPTPDAPTHCPPRRRHRAPSRPSCDAGRNACVRVQVPAPAVSATVPVLEAPSPKSPVQVCASLLPGVGDRAVIGVDPEITHVPPGCDRHRRCGVVHRQRRRSDTPVAISVTAYTPSSVHMTWLTTRGRDRRPYRPPRFHTRLRNKPSSYESAPGQTPHPTTQLPHPPHPNTAHPQTPFGGASPRNRISVKSPLPTLRTSPATTIRPSACKATAGSKPRLDDRATSAERGIQAPVGVVPPQADVVARDACYVPATTNLAVVGSQCPDVASSRFGRSDDRAAAAERRVRAAVGVVPDQQPLVEAVTVKALQVKPTIMIFPSAEAPRRRRR